MFRLDDTDILDIETTIKVSYRSRRYLSKRVGKCDDKEKYKYLCSLLKVTPCTKFIRCVNLTRLDLSYRGLTSSEISAICITLFDNVIINEIILQNNRLGDEGATYIAELLLKNKGITEVDISQNNVNEDGFLALSMALKENVGLKVLNISGNRSRKRGINSLISALEENNTLLRVDFSHCGIGDENSEYLGEMLYMNTMLTDLVLSWNSLTQNSIRDLHYGLSNNSSLEMMDISWNGIRSPAGKVLEKCLDKNGGYLKNLIWESNKMSTTTTTRTTHGNMNEWFH